MLTKTKAFLSPFWRIEPSYGFAFAPIYMIEIPWLWITDYWLKARPMLALLTSYLVVGILLLPTALALVFTLSSSIIATLAAPFVMIVDYTQAEKKPRPVVQKVQSPAKLEKVGKPHTPKPLKFAPIVYPSASSGPEEDSQPLTLS